MFNGKFIFPFFTALLGVSTANVSFVDELCFLAPGTTILKPHTCTDWIKCPTEHDAEEMEEGSCVFGLYFNKNTGRCEYKDNVNCPYDSERKNRCSHAEDGTFLADEQNCNGYIYCKGGEEMKSHCPNSLVFDPVKKACVYGHQYACPLKGLAASTNPLCSSLPDGLFFADKSDCTKFSECKSGALYTHNCNNTFGWDYLKGNCLPVKDVVCIPDAKPPEPEITACVHHVGPISDGVSCSGYYFCKSVGNDTYDRKPEHFTCPTGTFFDSNSLSCRNRLNVKCDLDRCEGMGDKYVNVANDCRSYVLCKNGVAHTKGVCPNSYYFDESTQSCTPRIINFVACAANE